MGKTDETQSAYTSSTDVPKVDPAQGTDVEKAIAFQDLRKEFENSAVGAVGASAQVEPTQSQESAEALSSTEAQALKNYEQQFADLQVSNKPLWDVVKHRLTADGNKKLKLAMALESTVIFGVGANRKVLFSDGGDEVPACTRGKPYIETRDGPCKEYKLFDENLMRQWETVTGRFFVENTQSWLESKDLLPSAVRFACLFSNFAGINVFVLGRPKVGHPDRGARRMLEV